MSAKLEILAAAILNGLLSLVLEMMTMLKGLYNTFWIVVLLFTASMISPCFIPWIQLQNCPTSGLQMEDFPRSLLLEPYVLTC